MNLFLILPVIVAVVILLGLRRLAPGAERIPAVAMVSWFGLVFGLSQAGVLANFELPPKIPMIALGAMVLAVFVARTAAVKEALRVMPSWWPVALMTFRAPLEIGLYLLFAAGKMPEQMTFTGRNFDVFVGVTAPLMAYLMVSGRAPKWLQWTWQIGSVLLLVNVVGIAITSAPGPLNLAWPGAPLTIVAEWPYALLPGFLVPIAALGHALSIARLRER